MRFGPAASLKYAACRLWATFFLAPLLFAALAGPARSDSPRPNVGQRTGTLATPDNGWNAVFDRRDGWTGADGAATVALGDGRVLWLFGDTWIGSIRGGKRQPGATMVNNSIAVHSVEQSAGWKIPDSKAVHFYWGANDAAGRPTAWAVPPRATSGVPSTGERREWFWPAGGGLAVDGPATSRRLYLFFFRVCSNPRGQGVWTFTVVGSALGVVDNMALPADRWKMRLLNFPHSLQPTEKRGEPADAEMTWGMAACLGAKEGNRQPQNAFIYGIRKMGLLNDSLVLARAPAAAIDRFQDWTFYAGKNSWASTAAAAAPLANGLVSEFSVERLQKGDRSTWVLLQSEPLLGKRIFLRTAPRPQGPWSTPQFVATVPDVERSRSYFTYAAKGHVALSRPGELLITYLVNSNQFADLMTDTDIYRPKFLRVPTAFLSSR